MIKAGNCMICGKDVSVTCKECGTKRFGSQYTEVIMTWSNGGKMPIGVCMDCAKENKHTTAHAKQQVTKAHHDHWREQGAQVDEGVILV